jgi:LysM repeat protein
MDNKDSNMKPQQTGGLKLMTVFIAVLALHVVVIGGVTVYHLMSGGSSDTDLGLIDKSHKSGAITDTTDAALNDKTISATTTPTEVATIPAATTPPTAASAPDQTAAVQTPAPAPAPEPTPAPAVVPAPAPATSVAAVKPAAPASAPKMADTNTPSGPITPELAPPAEPTVSTPSTPTSVATGPVHMPPAVASAPVHEHESAIRDHQQIYVVKITDSYKKIAHAHHVTVAQLKEANHIKGDVLHTGQKLLIPASHTAVASSAINTGLDAEPTKPVFTNTVASTITTTPSTTTPHHHYYTVVKGDTLAKIAHKLKTTPSAIMAANDIAKSTKLSVGKKLKIPSQDSRSARVSPPVAPAVSPVATPVLTPTPVAPSEVQRSSDDGSQGQLANFTP